MNRSRVSAPRWMAGAALSILLLLGVRPASAQQAMLTADTQINSSSPNTNYATATSLTVNATNSALVQFDYADLLQSPIAASNITRARLVIYVGSMTTAGSFNVTNATSTWTEKGVTYATKPALSKGYIATGAVTASGQYVYVNVSGLVEAWITHPNTNFGFEITPVGSTSFTMDSKESATTSHPAMLQYDLINSGPQGAVGPQGPQGPQGPAGPAGGSNVLHDGTLTGNGAIGTPLAVSNQLTLKGSISTAGPIFAQNPITESGGQPAMQGDDLSGDGIGVRALSEANGSTNAGYGLVAGGWIGVYSAGETEAGIFDGNVQVTGMLSKAGGSFKIDDPIDPANKYLSHSFVESPDMMNIYNGNVTTDGSGYAEITMPPWFEALNRDFRYQLTAIGQPAQVWVAAKIAEMKFSIRTDKPNVEVSWQVTGIRRDAWANAHRIPVEENKTETEQGHYLHPELFGATGQPSVVSMAPAIQITRKMMEAHGKVSKP